MSSRRGGRINNRLLTKRQGGILRVLAILLIILMIGGLLLTAIVPSQVIVIQPTPTPAAPLVGSLSATVTPRPEQRDFPRIEPADLKAMLDRKADLQLLDNSTAAEYDKQRIVGAKFYPATEMYNRMSELDKTKPVVLYCNCTAEQVSVTVGLRLKGEGFGDVRALRGGLRAWAEAGYPTEPSS